MENESKGTLPPGLYIVATPIGNLEDITLRAIRILKEVDVIACEDTRQSRILLSHYGITTRTISYNDYNGQHKRPLILARLEAGARIALISDAGTPLISDPGYKLVAEAREKAIAVTPLPGASSIITALCAAGLPTDQFQFIGFLPTKSKARDEAIARVAHYTGTLILLESPRRLVETLHALRAACGGERSAVVARELTKLHEEFGRGSLDELITHYELNAPRGEIVLLLAPAPAITTSADDIDALLRQHLATLPVKQAAAAVAALTGTSKSELYNRALALKEPHD